MWIYVMYEIGQKQPNNAVYVIPKDQSFVFKNCKTHFCNTWHYETLMACDIPIHKDYIPTKSSLELVVPLELYKMYNKYLFAYANEETKYEIQIKYFQNILSNFLNFSQYFFTMKGLIYVS